VSQTELATQQILAANGLELSTIEQAFGELFSKQVDDADLYFQHAQHESWVLEDSIIKEGSFNIESGVGIRAISGEKTGFSYTDNLRHAAILQSAGVARQIAVQGQSRSIALDSSLALRPRYQPLNPIDCLENEAKIAILHQAEKIARAEDPRVKEVFVSLSGVREAILVASMDGWVKGDIRPLVRLNVTVIAEDNGVREQGTSGGGGRFSYQRFIDQSLIEQYAKEAVRLAVVALGAVAAPAGVMPVVLGPGWPGVLLHEAVGHGLEGDFNRKQASVFAGKVGEKVASSLCTVVDDGTIDERRGSLSMDDEGTQTQRNVLIENGILKGYMQDRLNARLMGVAATGNGRRESYAHLPMPRMTNTFMLAGNTPQQEMIKSVKKGLFAVNFGGGQVDITSGKFVFSTSEAYLIENGKLTQPVKGATLIGSGPDVMQKISMVGDDLALDNGVGVCGKEGQSVPVGVGQPSMLIDELTVGGTAG
jgi:TldD protein